MKDLFRVSFSILDPWSHGDYDEATRRYLRIPSPPSQAMEDGTLFHRSWQTETTDSKRLPAVFGGTTLKNPSTELKMECVIDDWIQFVGVIDCMEDDTIHEYKTGSRNSIVWASTMQTRCYQVLTEFNGFRPKKALIHHFNQHTKKVTHSKVYLTDHSRQMATEWIRTYASELHEALANTGQLAETAFS